jgi:hypothetical protein
MGDRVVLGTGSAYGTDKLEPAIALVEAGIADYIGFDCLAERTLALAQQRRRADENAGHDVRLGRIVDTFAGYLRSGGRITGNFGAANPDAAARQAVAHLRAAGLDGLKVGVVRGDDVLAQVLKQDLELPEFGCRVSDLGERVLSANAYVGADGIVEALTAGARFVLGGRLADPSLFVAPLCVELGWALDDWDRLAQATLAGHLLECGVHSTGANFVDPPYRVAELLHLGAPVIETDGEEIIFTKTPGSDGVVDSRTAKAQIGYEIHDPTRYLTPDVTADFSQVWVRDVGPDRVAVGGATGTARPDTYKVLVAVDLGWKAVGEISFGGEGAVDRARLGEDLVRRRLAAHGADIDEIHVSMHGESALFGRRLGDVEPTDVRLRVAARSRSREAADALVAEMEYLYFGPAGAAGPTGSVTPAVAVTPAYLNRTDVTIETEVVSA